MSWTLAWTRPALKDMKKIDQRQAKRIREAVTRFAETGQGDVKKLVDEAETHREYVGELRL
jgi:mRNA-degrading endonuclease RelE of RelBE toxin-antitoxin system